MAFLRLDARRLALSPVAPATIASVWARDPAANGATPNMNFEGSTDAVAITSDEGDALIPGTQARAVAVQEANSTGKIVTIRNPCKRGPDLDQASEPFRARDLGRPLLRPVGGNSSEYSDIRLEKEISMNDDDKQRSKAEAEIEREIRQGRKFTAREAMGRMIGPGSMKGGSAVSKVQQAETEIGTWLRSNLRDSTGALQALLHRQLNESPLLLNNLDQPLAALADYCQQVLASDHHLQEVVREADVEWGRRMDERPHFNREGSAPHPDDPYTHESVRAALCEVLNKISEMQGGKTALSTPSRHNSSSKI